jgi:hypothetical protein
LKEMNALALGALKKETSAANGSSDAEPAFLATLQFVTAPDMSLNVGPSLLRVRRTRIGDGIKDMNGTITLDELKRNILAEFKQEGRDLAKTRIKLPCFGMRAVETEEQWTAMKQKWHKGKKDRKKKGRIKVMRQLREKMLTPHEGLGWTVPLQMGAMGVWEFSVRAENVREYDEKLCRALLDLTYLDKFLDVRMAAVAALWMMSVGPNNQATNAVVAQRIRRNLRKKLVKWGAVEALVEVIEEGARDIAAGKVEEEKQETNRGTTGKADKVRKESVVKFITQQATTKRLESQIGHLMKVQIMSCKGLAKADKGKGAKSDPYCLLYWQGEMIGESSYKDDNLNPVWDNEFVDIPLPAVASIPDTASFMLEVRDHDRLGKGDFLGQISLTGVQVKQMIHKTNQAKKKTEAAADSEEKKEGETEEKEGAVEDDKCMAENGDVHYEHCELEKKTAGSFLIDGVDDEAAAAMAEEENALVQGDISVGFHFESRVINSKFVREIKINVLSAKGLANADGKKGKSDPYALVFWNGKRIGQTMPQHDNLNPKFLDGEFVIELPQDISKCKLRVELRDFDKKGLGDFLGCVQLTGTELTQLPTGPCEYDNEERDNWQGKEDMSLSQGTCTIDAKIVERTAFDVSIPMEYMDAKGKASCTTALVTVSHASNLAKADKGGESDPFVCVYQGSRKIGNSSVVEDSCNPRWERERFVFALPAKTEFISLRAEVYDMDKKRAGDFLGQVECSGTKAFANLIDSDMNGVGIRHGRSVFHTYPTVEDTREGIEIEQVRAQDHVLKKRVGRTAPKKQKVNGTFGMGFECDDIPCTPVVLRIMSALGLAKADGGKDGASDPYCIIYWNGAKLGVTEVCENAMDPKWNGATFIVPIPKDADARAKCTLVIEVRDYDKPGELGDFLGQLVMPGMVLGGKNLPLQPMEIPLMVKSDQEMEPGPGQELMDYPPSAGKEDMDLVQGTLTYKFSTMGSAKLQAKEVGKLRKWGARARRAVMSTKQLINDSAMIFDNLKLLSPEEKAFKVLELGLGVLATFVWDPATDEADVIMSTPKGLHALLTIMGFEHAEIARAIAADVFSNCIAGETFDPLRLFQAGGGTGVKMLVALLYSLNREVQTAAVAALAVLLKSPEGRAELASQSDPDPPTLMVQLVKWAYATVHRLVSIAKNNAENKTRQGGSGIKLADSTNHFLQCISIAVWGVISINFDLEVARNKRNNPQYAQQAAQHAAAHPVYDGEEAGSNAGIDGGGPNPPLNGSQATCFDPLVHAKSPIVQLVQLLLSVADNVIIAVAAHSLSFLGLQKKYRKACIKAKLHISLSRGIGAAKNPRPAFVNLPLVRALTVLLYDRAPDETSLAEVITGDEEEGLPGAYDLLMDIFYAKEGAAHTSPGLKRDASKLLVVLSEQVGMAVNENVVSGCLRLLPVSKGSMVQNLAVALWQFAHKEENRRLVGKGLLSIIKVCSSPSHPVAAIEALLGLIFLVIFDKENAQSFLARETGSMGLQLLCTLLGRFTYTGRPKGIHGAIQTDESHRRKLLSSTRITSLVVMIVLQLVDSPLTAEVLLDSPELVLHLFRVVFNKSIPSRVRIFAAAALQKLAQREERHQVICDFVSDVMQRHTKSQSRLKQATAARGQFDDEGEDSMGVEDDVLTTLQGMSDQLNNGAVAGKRKDDNEEDPDGSSSNEPTQFEVFLAALEGTFAGVKPAFEATAGGDGDGEELSDSEEEEAEEEMGVKPAMYSAFTPESCIEAALVTLLNSADPRLVQYALVSFAWLATSAKARANIGRMGVVPRLVHLVRIGGLDEDGEQPMMGGDEHAGVPLEHRALHGAAIRVLLMLSMNDERNQILIAKYGLIDLINLLRRLKPRKGAQGGHDAHSAVSWTLENLMDNAKNRTAFYRAEMHFKSTKMQSEWKNLLHKGPRMGGASVGGSMSSPSIMPGSAASMSMAGPLPPVRDPHSKKKPMRLYNSLQTVRSLPTNQTPPPPNNHTPKQTNKTKNPQKKKKKKQETQIHVRT